MRGAISLTALGRTVFHNTYCQGHVRSKLPNISFHQVNRLDLRRMAPKNRFFPVATPPTPNCAISIPYSGKAKTLFSPSAKSFVAHRLQKTNLHSATWRSATSYRRRRRKWSTATTSLPSRCTTGRQPTADRQSKRTPLPIIHFCH